MFRSQNDTAVLAERIKALPDPYRRNAMDWLKSCTQSPMVDFELEMDTFLDQLHPTVRTEFVRYLRRILETAVQYFGA